MSWQTAAAAPQAVATYPSEQPPLNKATGAASNSLDGSAWGSYPAQPLTFRKDPASGIVYLTGWWDATYSSADASSTTFWTAAGYVLPTAFRPLRQVWLPFRSWRKTFTPTAAAYLYITPAGAITLPALGAADSYDYVISGLYFTDV